jgi:hypothetical protein
MIKLYVTEPMMVRVVGKDGANWEEFDPSEFQGDYEPRVQLDINVQAQQQERANMAKELLGAFLNDPDVNQQELKKLVLQRAFDLDPDEVGILVQPIEELPPEMMGELPPEMMGEMGGEMMPEMPPELMGEMPVDPMAEMPMEMPIEEPSPLDMLPPEILDMLAQMTPEEIQMLIASMQEPMMDAIEDPVTGELMPVDPVEAML